MGFPGDDGHLPVIYVRPSPVPGPLFTHTVDNLFFGSARDLFTFMRTATERPSSTSSNHGSNRGPRRRVRWS
jgi:hypothetical protein